MMGTELYGLWNSVSAGAVEPGDLMERCDVGGAEGTRDALPLLAGL